MNGAVTIVILGFAFCAFLVAMDIAQMIRTHYRFAVARDNGLRAASMKRHPAGSRL